MIAVALARWRELRREAMRTRSTARRALAREASVAVERSFETPAVTVADVSTKITAAEEIAGLRHLRHGVAAVLRLIAADAQRLAYGQANRAHVNVLPRADADQRLAKKLHMCSFLPRVDVLDGERPILDMIEARYRLFDLMADCDRGLGDPTKEAAAAALDAESWPKIDALDVDIRATPSLGPLGIALKLRLTLCELDGSIFGQQHWTLIESALADASRLCGGRDGTPSARRRPCAP